MSTDRVTVSILGKEYQVACSPDEQNALMNAAKELDRRMREVRDSGSIVGLERIAIMVALNLCHELQNPSADQGDSAATTASLARISKKLSAAI